MEKDEMIHIVRGAVADGIREAIADKDAVGAFWSAAFDQLQVRATAKTGSFVLGSMRALMSKMFLVVAVGLIVFSFFGWSGVVKLWHALVSGGG